MSKLAQNLIDTFKIVANDNNLLRLLYYPSNPFDPSKTEIKDLPDFFDIRKDRIIRAPKTNDIQSDKTKSICRICMYFGNGSNTPNERVDDQDIVFDIYTHVDTFEINEARSLKIIDQINSLINFKNVTGIGKMRSSNRFIIGNPPDGYIGYKVVYTFGSSKS